MLSVVSFPERAVLKVRVQVNSSGIQEHPARTSLCCGPTCRPVIERVSAGWSLSGKKINKACLNPPNNAPSFNPLVKLGAVSYHLSEGISDQHQLTSENRDR